MLSKLEESFGSLGDKRPMSPMKDLGHSETLAILETLCLILAVHGKDGLFRGLLICRGKLAETEHLA